MLRLLSIFLCSSVLLACASFAGKHSTKVLPTFTVATLASGNESSEIFIGGLVFRQAAQDSAHFTKYDIKTGKEKKIALPVRLQSRVIIGLFPFMKDSSKVYVLSQLQKAGADFPRLDLYDSSNEKWSAVKDEINCVNYSDLKVEKNILHMKCGEDYIHPPVSEKFSIKLPSAVGQQESNNSYTLKNLSNQKDIQVMVKATKKNFLLKGRVFKAK